MTPKHFYAALAGALILAGPAAAGSLEEPIAEPTLAPAPAPAPVTTIGGDWTGLYGGVQLGYADVTTDGDADLDGNGAIGGLTLGYDYDFGQWVVGGALDYDVADIDLDDAANLESVARLKARVGYDLGRSLIYGTGGWAQADTDNLDSSDGYFLGAGYEYLVTERISLGGEVLYHEFEDFDDSGIDVEATTAQVRATFRF